MGQKSVGNPSISVIILSWNDQLLIFFAFIITDCWFSIFNPIYIKINFFLLTHLYRLILGRDIFIICFLFKTCLVQRRESSNFSQLTNYQLKNQSVLKSVHVSIKNRLLESVSIKTVLTPQYVANKLIVNAI